jgi:hypothetical protein
MILGVSTVSFTLLHVIISLVGIASGFVVATGMRSSQRLPRWTAVFLTTTILTSVTGFFFHSKSFGPPHAVGVISLIILALALVALYGYHLASGWRSIYVITALAAQYLNCFVLVAQLFAKVPVLKTIAPTGSEPPFAVAQLVVLAAFVALGVSVLRRFHPAAPLPA